MLTILTAGAIASGMFQGREWLYEQRPELLLAIGGVCALALLVSAIADYRWTHE